MAWAETNQLDERRRFVKAALGRGEKSMAEVCREFGVSRKTGYKTLSRFLDEGDAGLADKSRAPRSHPNQTSPEVEAAILRVRKAHPTWGSKKILAVLEASGESVLPARSTIDAVLSRAGVVCARRRARRRPPERARPIFEATRPNSLWTMDFKGWFRVGDGTRCDPFTVNDLVSRSSLICRAMVQPKLLDVQRELEHAFCYFGLPDAILSDNGPPFASRGLAGLSRLAVRLTRLGIEIVFIQPGHPEQNGVHERFHRTLKAETASPPSASVPAQQRSFDRWQTVFNEERPHEALDMKVPAEVYELSSRSMPEQIPDFEYGPDVEVRRVRRRGGIKWKSGEVFVGEAFRGELTDLEAVDDGLHRVLLGSRPIGMLHE
jgi:putative transposase